MELLISQVNQEKKDDAKLTQFWGQARSFITWAQWKCLVRLTKKLNAKPRHRGLEKSLQEKNC